MKIFLHLYFCMSFRNINNNCITPLDWGVYFLVNINIKEPFCCYMLNSSIYLYSTIKFLKNLKRWLVEIFPYQYLACA